MRLPARTGDQSHHHQKAKQNKKKKRCQGQINTYWTCRIHHVIGIRGMDHDEADFGDNFFGEEDEVLVDMEVVREGMKLVPLSDMCFGEPDGVMDVESSMKEHILSPLRFMMPDQINFQGSIKQEIGARGIEYPGKKSFGDDSGKEIAKHAKIEANEIGSLDSMEAIGEVPTAAAKVAAEIGTNVLTSGVVAETGPCPDFSSWTVQDDLMLKNAMEAGAAMEALARGAVKFSQRYTVRELRERWRALLYDPEVSEQAAIRMLKSEVAATNPGKLSFLNRKKDPQDASRKRKLNSVRMHYYKMRKLIAAEKYPDDGEALPNKMATAVICRDSPPKSLLPPLDVCIFEPGETTLKELEPCVEESTFAQMVRVLAVGDVGAVVQAVPSTAAGDPLQEATHGREHMICVLNTEDTDVPSPPPGSIIHSPSFFPLVNSPLEIEGEENESSISGGEHEGTDEFEISAHELLPAILEGKSISRVALAGKMEPTLENLESSGRYSIDTQALTAGVQSGMLDGIQENDKEAIIPVGNAGIHISRSCGIALTSIGPMKEKSYSEDLCAAANHHSKSYSNLSTCTEHGVAFASHLGLSGQSGEGLWYEDGVLAAGALQEKYEESLESEEEMPSFSDVEAMILDMDLDPAFDEDVSARAESRRLYRRHRKTLMRLEQGANAALERTLHLRGAIAIFYGRHLRYFITRNEVLLGRVTQDIFVDIDLGKEGRANKVSRRQANIKLKEDGVFYLKNLGRRDLSVNNVSIATGQHASLGSNCLIEVGGMKFIFEINKKLVRQRVAEMMLSQQHG